jgi:hypothetical protein
MWYCLKVSQDCCMHQEIVSVLRKMYRLYCLYDILSEILLLKLLVVSGQYGKCTDSRNPNLAPYWEDLN